MTDPSQPLFDSTRAALRFALNYSASAPRSSMNKSMSDGVLGQEAVTELHPSAQWKRTVPLPTGLDGAAQAAMIAKQLDQLDERSKDCILALYMNSTIPCSCRSPCCRGHRNNVVWDAAVNRICTDIQFHIASTKAPGKRGMQEHPKLRRALVVRFFSPKGRDTIDSMALEFEVSAQTVISHKKVIEAWCKGSIKAALSTLDEVLSTSGIVGQMD